MLGVGALGEFALGELVPSFIAASYGTFTITGYDASFMVSLPCETGYFTLSGQTLDYQRTRPAKMRAFSRSRESMRARSYG